MSFHPTFFITMDGLGEMKSPLRTYRPSMVTSNTGFEKYRTEHSNDHLMQSHYCHSIAPEEFAGSQKTFTSFSPALS